MIRQRRREAFQSGEVEGRKHRHCRLLRFEEKKKENRKINSKRPGEMDR